MNEYVAEMITRYRIDEAVRHAQSANIRREVARTPARWHFPRVNWHFPVPTRASRA